MKVKTKRGKNVRRVNKKVNKKGIEINIATIIILILAVLALLLLVIGFTGGWTKLWKRITGTEAGAGALEVSIMVEQCKLWASLNNVVEYCAERNISIAGKIEELNCGKLREKYNYKDIPEMTC